MYLDIFISLYLYIFLFSDGWADRTDVIQGLESAAIGKIEIKILVEELYKFVSQ